MGQGRALSQSASSVLVTAATGTAEMSMTKLAQNDDGTPLIDIAGYKIRYGALAGALTIS